MTEEVTYFGKTRRFARRTFSVGWKLAIVAMIAAFAVFRLRFAPVPVEANAAVMGAITSEVTGTGTLEARVSATISPKISGLITQVFADQGDHITKDQLLATLYDGDLRGQENMANADLAATKAGLDRAAADIAAAEATAREARVTYGRDAKQVAQGILSEDNVDKSTQLRDVAEAQLKRAQAAKVEMDRQVIKGEATLQYYQERLMDTKIFSPFDGLVTRRSREPGDIAVPGSEILQVISTEQMWVSAWVDESAIGALAVGQPVRVVFRSDPNASYSGTVTRVAPRADRETREFLVDVTVKDLPKSWAVGQRAEVYIQTAQKDRALLAPSRAIVWRKGQPGLFVDLAGKARWRNVTLGLRGAETVEIADGVTAGETVIWPRDSDAKPLAEGRAVAHVAAP